MADNLQQMYRQALEAHEQGEYGQAVALYERILHHHPDADLVLYNYGLALYQLNRFAEAADAFTQAAAIRQDDADTWFNLGLSLKQDNRFDEARYAYERALELHEDEDVLFNLANCCREDRDFAQASVYFQRLLEMAPDHISGLNNAAYVFHLQGKYNQAGKLYKRLLVLQPDHGSARHMLAALNGTAETAPANEYVRDLFDQYSDSFEQSLVENLQYRVPELLFSLLEGYDNQTIYRNCLDLGCGTGLAGAAFKRRCTTLTGVDLSAKMVAVAQDKGLYDALHTDDVLHFLQQNEQRYELVVAADLLTYLADLEPLFREISFRSTPGSLFIFSTEHGDKPGWQIRSTGRFAHHREYITQLAGKFKGRIVRVQEENLRREGDSWVAGDIYIIQFSG